MHACIVRAVPAARARLSRWCPQYEDRTLVTLDSANRPGTLVEVVQLLTELGLNVIKARISSDGGWFVDEVRAGCSRRRPASRLVPKAGPPPLACFAARSQPGCWGVMTDDCRGCARVCTNVIGGRGGGALIASVRATVWSP